MTPVKVRELPGVSPSLDTVEFLQACPSKFRCHLCTAVHGGLLQADCGHGFCPPCLASKISSNKPSFDQEDEGSEPEDLKCPVDGKVFKIEELLKEDKIPEVLCLEVFCPHRKRGCKRSMPLRTIQSHLQSCGFVAIFCPCDCGEEVSRRDLADHLTNKCQLRLEQCKYCEDEIPIKHQEDHLKMCSKLPIVCPFCNIEITQDQSSSHEKKCLERPRVCNLAPIGCTFKGTAVSYKAHEGNVKEHISLLTSAVLANRGSLQKVIDILNDLNSQVNYMQTEIKELQRSSTSIKELQKTVSNMQLEIKILNAKLDEDGRKTVSPRGLFNHFDSGRNSPAGSEAGRSKQSAPPTPL